MELLLLGTAAGGGFPQWNCSCAVCTAARDTPRRATPRTQSSLAVSADGRHWFLCNASPDVRLHLAMLPLPLASGSPRVSPIEGVLLTDAELDHSVGLLSLREGGSIDLYATDAAIGVLEHDSAMLPTIRAFAKVRTTTLVPGRETALRLRDGTSSGLSVEAVPVAGGAPRFARDGRAHAGAHAVALVLRDEVSGSRAAYVPGCGAMPPALRELLASCDAVLFDGTFWSDGELAGVTSASPSLAARDHLPVSGPSGSLATLASLPSKHRVYVHLNNTNPMLIDDGAEQREVERAGVTVGVDGMRFTI